MTLSKRQKALRANGIGSSEIGVLAGLDPWGASPIQIYESKVHGVEKDATLQMRLGSIIEDPIAQLYAEDHHRFLVKCDTIQSPTHPLALSTPDRLVLLSRDRWTRRPDALASLEDMPLGEKLLEVKHAGFRTKHLWGDAETDQVPEYYLAQGQWHMGVTGHRECDVFVLFDKDEVRRYKLVFNEALFAALYDIAARFWRNHVVKRQPPAPDASLAYEDYLKRAYPAEASRSELLTPDEATEAAVLRYAQLKEVKRRCELLLRREANTIKTFIGEAGGLVSPRFGRLTWFKNRDGHKVNFEAAYREAHTLLALLVDKLPAGEGKAALEQRLSLLEKDNTREVTGPRILRGKWSGDAAFKALPEVQVKLEAVNPKDNEDDDE